MTNSEIQNAYIQYRPNVYNYVSSIIDDKSQAEDIVQIAYYKLYLAAKDNKIFNPKHWLLRVARNLTYNYIRDTKKIIYTGLCNSDTRAIEYNELPNSDLDFYKSKLIKLINNLPKKDKDLLKLKFWGDKSYKSIAEQLNITETNVGFRLNYIINKLKPHIKRHEN